MTRIKLNLALVAMVLGCTLAFAFKAPSPAGQSPQTWFYHGGTTTLEASYSLVPVTCQSGSNTICTIVTDEDPANPGEPLINAALSTRISMKDVSQGDVTIKR